jgi:ppGpp synthetase/RelA/SpoT-type nucleotidyltranferase
VEDVIGFRYSTLFQSDVPRVIRRLLTTAFGWENTSGKFRLQKGAKVTIHTSRPENDPLTIVESVRRAFSEWGGPHEIEVRSRATGYSSIHVVLWHITPRWPGDADGMPVEFQLRSGLEQFWGRLDHQLRYELGRGHVGDSLWERHLNVLKAQFDAAIQYLDVIKEVAVQGIGSRNSKTASAASNASALSSGSFSSTDSQLKRLADLPDELYRQVKKAFSLWVDADASKQFGGDPNLFREAAAAFQDLLESHSTQLDNTELEKRFTYIAKMERAYMLFCTQDTADMQTAAVIYSDILADYPDDASGLLRQGQAKMRLGQTDEAIEFFERAASGVVQRAWDDEATIVRDFARRNHALCFFRKFEKIGETIGARRTAIKQAIELSKEIYESTSDHRMRQDVLNNLVYFAWEEREFCLRAPGQQSLSDAEYEKIARELITVLDDSNVPTFREADTLVRTHFSLGDEGAASIHAQSVCMLLEKAAQARSGGLPELALERFNFRWVALVLPWLAEEDEKDALLFSVTLLSRKGETNVSN